MHRTSICSLGLALLLGMAQPALAQLTQGPSGSPPDPSLLLLIWDPVNKVAYTRDTGLTGGSLRNSLTSSQQQTFWTLDPAQDQIFAQFAKASTDFSQDYWLVIGAGVQQGGTASKYSGGVAQYMTMKNTVLVNGQPTLNNQWPTLIQVANSALFNNASTVGTALYNNLNAGSAPGLNSNPYNTYATAAKGQGESFETATSNAYVFDGSYGLQDPFANPGTLTFGGTVDTANVIGANGSSSWFYYLTTSVSSAGPNKPTKGIDPMQISAFANSTQLAYWGLARTTNATNQQELVLSFTLPAAVTPTTTAAGATRRNGTDYIASYGAARLIDMPTGVVTAATAVSVVPEPSSWLLMAGGLLGVGAAARRQRRRT